MVIEIKDGFMLGQPIFTGKQAAWSAARLAWLPETHTLLWNSWTYLVRIISPRPVDDMSLVVDTDAKKTQWVACSFIRTERRETTDRPEAGGVIAS